MNNKQSPFDYDLAMTIVGWIIVLGIPLFLVFGGYEKLFSGESCDADCAYGNKMVEQRSDPGPDPIDYNRDGIITRDEAEDNPTIE